MNSANLLIDERPLIILPSLVKAIGLEEAIFLQQLHYWLGNPDVGVYLGEIHWVYNTHEEWQKNFPFWTPNSIGRIIRRLEKKGIVLSCQPNVAKYDHTKYYRIDYEAFSAFVSQK